MFAVSAPGKAVSSRTRRRASRQPKASIISERQGLTIDELRAVLEVCKRRMASSIIRFGLYSGQRFADIASPHLDAVDLSRE